MRTIRVCAARCSYPVEHGAIRVDDDDLDLFLSRAFDDMRGDPRAQPVLMSEAPRSAFRDRERLVQHVFETFAVPATYIANAGPLAAYASGRCTSFQVGVGDITSTFPVYEG